jgi:hypothetical protein
MNSIVGGIEVDRNDDLRKASNLIRVKREFDSNVIGESDSQF